MTEFAAGLIGWLTQSHARTVGGLLLLALLVFVPGIVSIPPVDRDEALFVQSTRQMLETSNYVDIRFQDVPRYKKPVGIYWLQAAAANLTGYGAEAPIWVYRLASVAGAIGGVLLTYWAGVALFDRRAALVAGALMAVSLVLASEAHLAKTDAALLATVVLAQGALARVYLAREKPSLATGLLFWAGIGAGILIKGPVILMIAGLTILTLVIIERRARWLLGLHPVPGVLLAAAIVLPWLVAIFSISGNAFLGQSVGNDFLGKLASGQQGHSAPPGTHFVLLWVMFAPGAALIPAAVGWVWRVRIDPSVRFCLAWLVPSFLAFEAVTTKLPHYPLPTYPAIALLIGAAVAAGGLRMDRALGYVPAAIALGMALLWAAAVLALMDWFGGGATIAAFAVAGIVAVLVALAIEPVTRGEAVTTVVAFILVAASLYVLAFGIVLPATSRVLLTPRLVAAVDTAAKCPEPVVFSAGYSEPSLVFAAGTGTQFGDGEAAANFLKTAPCGVAVVAQSQRQSFLVAVAKAGMALTQPVAVDGLNLGRFGMISAEIYAVAPSPP